MWARLRTLVRLLVVMGRLQAPRLPVVVAVLVVVLVVLAFFAPRGFLVCFLGAVAVTVGVAPHRLHHRDLPHSH